MNVKKFLLKKVNSNSRLAKRNKLNENRFKRHLNKRPRSLSPHLNQLNRIESIIQKEYDLLRSLLLEYCTSVYIVERRRKKL